MNIINGANKSEPGLNPLKSLNAEKLGSKLETQINLNNYAHSIIKNILGALAHPEHFSIDATELLILIYFNETLSYFL